MDAGIQPRDQAAFEVLGQRPRFIKSCGTRAICREGLHMTSDERNDAIPYSQSRLWIVYWQKRPGEEDQFSPRSESRFNKFKMGAGSQNRHM